MEGIVFVAAAAQDVLLHATPDLIDHLGPQPDHVEGIEHSDRVREAVADRVGISAERIQGGLFDAVDEPIWLCFQPGLVDRTGAPDDRVEESGVEASGLVTGEIDHDGDGSVDPDP